MKRILIILLCLMPFTLFGQKQFIRNSITSDTIYFYRGVSLLNLPKDITKLNKNNGTATGTLTTAALNVGGRDLSIDSISYVDGKYALWDGVDTVSPHINTVDQVDISDIAAMQVDSLTKWVTLSQLVDSLAGGSIDESAVAAQINDSLTARLSAAVEGLALDSVTKYVKYDFVIQEISGVSYATPLTGAYTASHNADLTVVLTNALGQLTGGGSVLIKRGTYDGMSTVVIPYDNITIDGEGRFLTKLKLKASADAGTSWGNLFYCGGPDGFTVRNLDLDGNGLNQVKVDNRGGTNRARSIGICANDSTGSVYTNKLLVENCYIHDFARDGVVWSRGNGAIVRNTYLYNNFIAGVEFWGLTTNGRIDNCEFRKNTGISLYGDKHTVSDCTFEYPYNAHMWQDYDFGISLESQTYGPDDVSISNCVFKGDTLTYGIFSATNGMRNLTINNVYIKSSDPDHYAIMMVKDTATMITNSHIIGTKYGITLNDAQYATVSNNHIDGGALQGIQLGASADNNNIHDNYVRKTAGYPVYINAGATANIVANNILTGTWANGSIIDNGTNTIPVNNYSTTDGVLDTLYVHLADSTGNAVGNYITNYRARTMDSDTIPLFVFGAGAGLTADTALFNNGALIGSFYNAGSDTLHITELRGVLKEGTGTETIAVGVKWHTTFLSGSATALNTTDLTITSITTGTVDNSFNNNDIPPGRWVWCTLSGASKDNKPTHINLTMTGYKRNRKY
jgi:hypothetical protein